MPDRIFNMQHRYARIFQPLSESGILISQMKRFVKTDTQKKLSRNKKVHTYKVRFLVARILTLEAYSLGVMPVTFLKWREK